MMPWEIVAYHPVYQRFSKAIATDQVAVTEIGSFPVVILPEIPLIPKVRTANVLPDVRMPKLYNPR